MVEIWIKILIFAVGIFFQGIGGVFLGVDWKFFGVIG